MANSHVLRVVAAAAVGAASGLVITGSEALSPSAVGIVAARILGWGWGWAAPVVLLACLLGWGLRRRRDSNGARLTVALGTTAAMAAFVSHWLVSTQLGGSWSWWGLGVVALSPVLGLLGWLASARSGLGVFARTLVPAAAMAEALLLAPSADAAGRVAWFELLACGVMLWGGLIASIVVAGVGAHAGVAVTVPLAQPVGPDGLGHAALASRPVSQPRPRLDVTATTHQPAA